MNCFVDMNSRELSRKIHLLLIIVSLCFFILSIKHVEAKRNVHIVYLGGKKHDDPQSTKKSHHKLLTDFLGSKEVARRSLLYSYKHGFSGFAARLTDAEAESIAENPEVVQVIRNRVYKLHTTRSWDFIGISHGSAENAPMGNMGTGTIVGVIDTGVWPESASFSDEGMPRPPSRWRGICQKGAAFGPENCNRKIIGARWFVKGYMEEIAKPVNGTVSDEYLSARDDSGHGTHTASTVGGAIVEHASYGGLAAGVARGGAPRAHLAIYKACWDGGCANADLLKAFDKAIHDGVDVLSLSIGSQVPLFSYVDHRDTIAIGSLHATAAGITVVSSAGNDGPTAQTVSNTAPWLITVAATTIDRAFPTAVRLGNNRTVWGQSLYTTKHNRESAGLTYSERIPAAASDASPKDCKFGSLNRTLASGKIVLCFVSIDDDQNMYDASEAVQDAGGVGLIIAQPRSDGLQSCLIPCVRVDYEVGTQILSYVRRARSPMAKLSAPTTVIGKWMSPRVATFSSRGPSSLTPVILKPDIAAPGVDILAAFPPSSPTSKHRKDRFRLLSGTSMACPHIAAIAALIKSVHRNWSPAAIRSALITTASQTGNDGSAISADGPTRKMATPFDMGGGHVAPTKAVDPGLIYDVATDDYIQFLCSLGYQTSTIAHLTNAKIACARKRSPVLNLNLPSITVPNLKTASSVTVTRTVTNVGEADSVYTATVHSPAGVEMRVDPRVLRFNTTTRILSFKVRFYSSQRVHGEFKYGSLTWSDGKHRVRSPVSVRVIRFESYSDV